MAKDYSYMPCPRCGRGYLEAVSERQGGFSGGKAALGALFVGPIGLAAGAFGRKKTTFRCNKCGYIVEN
ncbi:MAG: hypothetical protein E7583_11685 [Ruminococcaceae bacterium]|nr:hypothetical protein [Oscillospiraceae bacterium]